MLPTRPASSGSLSVVISPRSLRVSGISSRGSSIRTAPASAGRSRMSATLFLLIQEARLAVVGTIAAPLQLHPAGDLVRLLDDRDGDLDLPQEPLVGPEGERRLQFAGRRILTEVAGGV